MFRKRALLTQLFILLTCFISVTAVSAPGKPAQQLTLGVLADRPESDLRKKFQPLADYLTRSLPGCQVRLETLSFQEIESAVTAKRLDFVLTNPVQYIQISQKTGLPGAVATLMEHDAGNPHKESGGVIIKRAGHTDIAMLKDLAGKTIATAGINSLGGYVAPLGELVAAGVPAPPDSKLVITGMPHERVIAAVLDGRADVGFVRTDVIEEMISSGQLDPTRIEIINARTATGFPHRLSTRLYPEWPFVVLPHVPENVARAVVAALMSLPDDAWGKDSAHIHGFTLPADYEKVETLMRDLHQAPFNTINAITIKHLWDTHYLWLITLAGLVLLAIVLTIFLLIANRRLSVTQGILERSAINLHALLNNFPFMVWFKDCAGRFLAVNRHFVTACGAAGPADVIGKTDRDFWPEELAELYRRDDRVVMESRRSKTVEEPIDDAGKRTWIETYKAPVIDANGQLVGTVGFSRDITARIQTREALQKSEEQFRTLFHQHSAIFLLFDPETWMIMDANDSAEHFYGYNRDELCGMNISRINMLPPEDLAERLDEALHRTKNRFIFPHQLKNGDVRAVESYLSPIDMQGKVLLFSILHDITDRLATETLLQSREKMYAAIFDHIGIGVSVIDKEMRVVSLNPVLRKWFPGIKTEDKPHCFAVLNVPSRIEACGDCPAIKTFRDGLPHEAVIETPTVNGIRNYKLVSSPIFDANGQITSVIKVVEDVTEQVNYEQGLREAKLAAEYANRSKSEFLANMSHEIRTPLNGVSGMSQLLRLTELTTDQEEYLRCLDTSVANLLSMVNDVLDLSKIDAGKIELEEAPFSVAQCIQEVISTQITLVKEKQLEIRTVLSIPPALVIGDPLRVKQVLLNLLSNAVKFTSKGTIEVRAEILEQDEKNALFDISVADTGEGIQPENLERIFAPFEQADGSITRRYGGTGLGLAICNKLAELMGGRMRVESTVGEGSKFHLVIPFTFGPAVLPDKPQETTRSAQWDGGALRILVADDNDINRSFMGKILETMGHAVACVENGAKAVEEWRKGRFDCILMDIQMPVMGGVDATALIRQEEQESQFHTPIIALTAHALKGDREQLLASGFDDYVSKPVVFDDLIRKLKKAGDAYPVAEIGDEELSAGFQASGKLL